MARLTNTPRQTLTLDLERRKSYSFRCVILDGSRNPVDLAGCTVRFVMKQPEYDGDLFDMTNLIVNSEGTIASPESGEVSFNFQAAELDGPPGEYNYAVVLWTMDGFSLTLLKGTVNLYANTESLSITKRYTSNTASAAIEIILRGSDVVEVIANTMPQGVGGTNIVGTGRPDQPETLEAKSLALVASAPIGAVFVSLDGAGQGYWAWRRRTSGWSIIEGFPITWDMVINKPSTYTPAAHTHSVSQISATGTRLATTYLSGSGAWSVPVVPWSNVTGAPSTFAPSSHTHLSSDISNSTVVGRELLSAFDAEVARGVIGAGTSSLELGYTSTTAAAGDHVHGEYATWDHGHQISGIAGLQAALDGKAASGHTHTIANVTNLQSILDGKADTGHTHTIAQVANLQSALDGKSAASHSHGLADLTAAGTRSSSTWLRGDGTWAALPAGITDHGDLTGLADDDHPQYALANGTRGSFAALIHEHTIAEVTGLQTALDGKAAAGHSHGVGDITAAGSPSASTYLRGDGTWGTPNIVAALNDLSNVSVASAVSGDVLTFNGTSWISAANSGGSGGVTDHSLLSGLSGDDHPQYALTDGSRGAFAATTHAHAIADTTGLQTALDGKSDTGHAHTVSDVTGLQTALDGKAATGHTHTEYAPVSHAHPISEVTSLQTALDGKAASSHTHTIANTTGLQTALDGKSDTGHTHSEYADAGHVHVIADTTGLQTALDGKAASSHTHTIANTTGLQTALDGKAASSHTHTASDISDSTTTGRSVLTASTAAAARTAIGAGTSSLAIGTTSTTAAAGNHTHSTYAPTSHTHTIANITNLQTTLDGKAASSHTHTIANITNLQTTLDGKASTSHTHSIANVTGLQTALDGKASTSLICRERKVITSDFTISAGGLASYTYTFEEVYSKPPVVVANFANGPGGLAHIRCDVISISTTACTLRLWNSHTASITLSGLQIRLEMIPSLV